MTQMFYQEYPPPTSLKKYIKCFWALEHDYTEEFHTYEHLWADTHTELIFSYGKPYYLKDNDRQNNLPKNFAIFPFKKGLFLYSDGFTGFVAIRFQPWAIHKIINKPVSTLIDKIVGADKLFRENATILSRQLNNKSREEKIKILTDYFLNRIETFESKEIATQRIAQEIILKNGIVSIKNLSEKFGTNSRKIERDFISEIGISAKLFSRIIRFNNARELLAQNPKTPLTAVAYEIGYADQAHFNKNFKELFGITPVAFKQQLLELYKLKAENKPNVVFLQDNPS